MDPYVVTRLLLETVCSQEQLPASGGKKQAKGRAKPKLDWRNAG
jgi:hypothetical protein